MAELKQDPMHPLKHEQCYLCFTTLVEPPPPNAPSREQVRRPHKEYMAKLESEGRLFGARAARDAAAPEALKNVCTQFLASLSTSYGTPSPSLTLLGPRPHSTHEGRLANEIFGDYDIKFQKIRL